MEQKRMRNYVIISYAVFWMMVLGICGTASMVFKCPPVVLRIMSNVCAWSPTFVLLLGMRYFKPGTSIKEFYKKSFAGKIRISKLVLAAVITAGATVSAVLILSLIQGKPFTSYWTLGGYPLWASFLFSLTTGPTGEEAGWRGYVRPYLNKRYNFYKASILQGLIWTFWHTVLWFVDSDFLGWDMIPYVLSNVIVITSICFVINTFMEGNDNLLYGIVIHFCFNILYCFLAVDIWFYLVLIGVYCVITGVICARRKRLHLDEKNHPVEMNGDSK
ncbi:MAG: CPBP family intramembrane metalloprotease [bacterium]|nr:CPBP family intramembrane metalloprotease [bacterium]